MPKLPTIPPIPYDARASIYRKVVAALIILGLLHFLAPDQVAGIADQVAIILGIGGSGLAVKYTPRGPKG